MLSCLPDACVIFLASLATALVSEALLHYFVYSGARYRQDTEAAAATVQKLEVERRRIVRADRKPQHAQKVEALERSLKEVSRRGNRVRTVTLLAVSALYMLVYRLLVRQFRGRAVVRLPFAPAGFIARVTHRGVPGDDLHDAGFTFVYMLCSMTLRGLISKLAGHEAPRVALSPARRRK